MIDCFLFSVIYIVVGCMYEVSMFGVFCCKWLVWCFQVGLLF